MFLFIFRSDYFTVWYFVLDISSFNNDTGEEMNWMPGFCPNCNEVMFDVCVHCESRLVTDNAMQVKLEMDTGQVWIPICNKCELNVKVATNIITKINQYNITAGRPVISGKVKKVMRETLIKQKNVV